MPDYILRLSQATNPGFVRRRVFVYIFENSPLNRTAYAHVLRAIDIWRQADIDFVPTWQRISNEDAIRLLGNDQAVNVNIGFIDRDDEPGYTERSSLSRLKSGPDALGIFFVNIVGDNTRADPDNFQVYVGHDLPGAPIGRTVAHEIGHLLLGVGHTGHQNIRWSSGLMYAGNTPNTHSLDTDISAGDAEIARYRAMRIPSDV